jgi:hypothetical protein
MERDSGHDLPTSEEAKPRYDPPRVVAYAESDLLDMIGPAVACARWPGAAPVTRGWSYEPGKYEDF